MKILRYILTLLSVFWINYSFADSPFDEEILAHKSCTVRHVFNPTRCRISLASKSKVLEQNRDMVRIMVATVNLCARQDIGLGDRVSQNAIENNFMENVRELFELDEDDSIFQTKKEKGTEEALEELQERQEIVRKEELVEYGKDIAYLVQYIATHPGETMDFMQGKVQEGWEFSKEHPFDAMKTVGTEVGLWFLPTVVLLGR